MQTGVTITNFDKLVGALGGVVTDDPRAVDYVVAWVPSSAVPLRRTPKLMVALNSGVKGLVTSEWLEASAAAGRALDPAQYPVRDTEKEKLWGCDFAALARGGGAGAGIFAGYETSVGVT